MHVHKTPPKPLQNTPSPGLDSKVCKINYQNLSRSGKKIPVNSFWVLAGEFINSILRKRELTLPGVTVESWQIVLGLWHLKTDVCLATSASYCRCLIQNVCWNDLALCWSLASLQNIFNLSPYACKIHDNMYFQPNHKDCSMGHHNKMFIAVSSLEEPPRPLHVTWLFSKTNLAGHRFCCGFSGILVCSVTSHWRAAAILYLMLIKGDRQQCLISQDRCSF